jgi:hypothetical protein
LAKGHRTHTGALEQPGRGGPTPVQHYAFRGANTASRSTAASTSGKGRKHPGLNAATALAAPHIDLPDSLYQWPRSPSACSGPVASQGSQGTWLPPTYRSAQPCPCARPCLARSVRVPMGDVTGAMLTYRPGPRPCSSVYGPTTAHVPGASHGARTAPTTPRFRRRTSDCNPRHPRKG